MKSKATNRRKQTPKPRSTNKRRDAFNASRMEDGPRKRKMTPESRKPKHGGWS